MRARIAIVIAAAVLTAPAAWAQAQAQPQAQQPNSLSQLLQQVKLGWNKERVENQQREQDFRRRKEEQQKLLADAKATLAREEARSEGLETQYQANEINLTQLGEQLKERLGNLGELFGVVRQVSGDTRSNIENSIVSAQIPDRAEFLDGLGQSKSLPAIHDLERLWFILHQEATASGEVARFPTTVVNVDGVEEQRPVVRVGSFTAISNGKFLNWKPEVQKLAELVRQPPSRYVSTVAGFESASSGLAPLSIDPSRGVLLGLFVEQIGTFSAERVEQGGWIGYAIVTLGAITFVVGVLLFALNVVRWMRVNRQKGRDQIDKGNALGRVLSVFEENKHDDAETLELKLDEAILRESSRLDFGLWFVKVVTVVAPLMGLLGTVTGMIETFQSITLFGTGDPKMMAGGISEALVTTMLGLMTAIPLTLIHAFGAGVSKSVVDLLEEQSAGLVATRAEQGASGA